MSKKILQPEKETLRAGLHTERASATAMFAEFYTLVVAMSLLWEQCIDIDTEGKWRRKQNFPLIFAACNVKVNIGLDYTNVAFVRFSPLNRPLLNSF